MGLLKNVFGTPSQDDFAALVMDSMRHERELGALVYEPEWFRLRIVNGASSYFNLHNAYEEYCGAPWHRRKGILKRWASLSAQLEKSPIPGTFREAQSNLLPRVRERAYHSLTALQAEVAGLARFNFCFRPLSDHLGVELVYDLPDSIALISQDTLEGWGVGFQLGLDVAARNLAEHSAGRFDRPRPGVYLSPWKDNHDASRLILVDLIRELPVKGDHLVMVPNRDTLIVTGSEDVQGMSKMADLTERAMSEPRFMTGIPVQLQWDRWIPLRLDPAHPLYSRFELLRLHSTARDYAEQKSLLERLHEKTGQDIYVAEFNAVQNPETGKLRSYCVWSKDVVSFLPRADQICFYDDDRPADERIVALASWGRVREVVGDSMVQTISYPERYLVESFPTAEELARIGHSA
jgi:hypothetical protein